MNYSLDANILIDLLSVGLKETQPYIQWSFGAYERAVDHGDLFVSLIAFAEISTSFDSADHALQWLNAIGIADFEAPSLNALYQAGCAHAKYRHLGGTRDRTLPDFIIGAEAQDRGATLITRDMARYRTYVPHLKLIAPDL